MLPFTATLYCRHDGQVTMYLVDVPPEVVETFGPRRRVWVRGTANGVAFETTLLPRSGGEAYLILNFGIRQRAGARLGEKISLAIEENPVPRDRTFRIPDDFAEVLADYPDVQAAWNRLTQGRQRNLIVWIEEAKQLETRAKRMLKSLDLIVQRAPKPKD